MTRELEHHQTYLIEEFAEAFLEGRMARREMLRRVVAVCGSATVAASTLLALGCGSNASQPEPAATEAPNTQTRPPPASSPSQPSGPAATAVPVGPGVSPDDPAIRVEDVRFKGPASDLLGYLARPNREGAFPGVVVIHENRGLQPQTRDVARRYAKEGFAALAVDLASRIGGTKADPAETSAAFRAGVDQLVADLLANVDYLKSQGFVRRGGLGVTGFCFGGGMTWETAIASRDINAAVPYYGSLRLMDALAQTGAAILAIYAENDPRITAQAPEVEKRLKEVGKPVETRVYPGTRHGFFNDTGTGYHAQAAAEAWAATLGWFRKYLPST